MRSISRSFRSSTSMSEMYPNLVQCVPSRALSVLPQACPKCIQLYTPLHTWIKNRHYVWLDLGPRRQKAHNSMSNPPRILIDEEPTPQKHEGSRYTVVCHSRAAPGLPLERCS